MSERRAGEPPEERQSEQHGRPDDRPTSKPAEETGERTDERAGPAAPQASWISSLASDDRFRAGAALSPGALLDAGLPLAIFTVIYTAGGRDLRLSLWIALASGVVLGILRLARREPMQNVIAGFIGLGLAVFVSSRTGRAEDVFLPGLLINVGYGVAYLVSVLVRWPIIGVLVGFVTGQGTSWRRDRGLMRAYSTATLLWVGMFAARLAVQAPLYFAGEEQLGWLATARLVMSWPLFLLVAYLSYLIIRPAYRAFQESSAAVEKTSSDTPPGSTDRSP